MKLVIHTFKAFFILLSEFFYTIATDLYRLLLDIADANIFTNEVIEKFSRRVYVLLGIFMLFKVSFSLINYIVNPENFTDKEKGVGKLVPNVMITMVLIVFTPRIFAEAMDLQHLVLNQNLFERIILGDSYIENDNKNNAIDDSLATTVFGAFYYYPSSSVLGAGADFELTSPDSKGNKRYKSLSGAFSKGSRYSAYDGIWDDTSESQPLLAVIAAIFLVLVLIQFCFDIAVRTIKFGFLQLVAAIPIISRIDPKSAKDGMFSKWLKLCMKTYLDLFIRLIALFFAIALIDIVSNNLEDIGSRVDSTMVKVALILGTLLFAKQLPKLLEDLFGFKLDGGFTLNPMKRMSQVPLVGNKINAGVSMAEGALLAGGRFAANTVGGNAKLLAGNLGGKVTSKLPRNRFTNWLDKGATKLTMSGESTIDNRSKKMKQRMDYTIQESSGRFRQGGWFDSGTEYKGTTAHQLYENDREQVRKLKNEGRKEHYEMDINWQSGNKVATNIDTVLSALNTKNKTMNPDAKDFDKWSEAFNGKFEDAYRMTYNSEEFIKSKMAFDKASAHADKLRDAIAQAQQEVSSGKVLASNVWTVKFDDGEKMVINGLEEFNKQYEKSLKIKTGSETNHNTMRKIHQADAKLEDQIKYRKNNDTNPTKA